MSNADDERWNVYEGDFRPHRDVDVPLAPAPLDLSVPADWPAGERRTVCQTLLIEGKPYILAIQAVHDGARLIGYLDTLSIRGPMPVGEPTFSG